MSKRTLIAKLKVIAAHDEQMKTIRELSDLIDEISAAAVGATSEPSTTPITLTEILEAGQ
jgi:hypothetical protein